MINPRNLALKLLLKIKDDDAYSNIVLKNAIEEYNLSKLDSAFLSALVYGVLERKLTLDYILKQYSKIPIKKIDSITHTILYLGIYQLIYMDKVPDSAAVNESVKLAKKNRLQRSSGFINAILRNIIRNNKKYSLPNENNIVEYLSIKYSCPKEIINLWINSYGLDNAKGILNELSGRPPLFARVNTIKVSQQELVGKLENENVNVEYAKYIDNALQIENTGSIERLDSFKCGDFFIEDLSSQIAVSLLSPQEGQTLCDVCAAPGGKSLCSAVLMNNNGNIYSYDLYKSKLNLLDTSAKRMGVNIIKTEIRDALKNDLKLPKCERLICDVPCSGNGIMRRKPEIRYKKDTISNNLPTIQYQILCNACDCITTDGILMYSTCTLNPKENHQVVQKFLNNHSDFEPVPINLQNELKRGIEEPHNEFTFFPHITGTDGFFIALLRKRG